MTTPAFPNTTILSLDLETTGPDICVDRIVEIALILDAPGKRHVTTTRVNPGVPIPPAATKVHGITDDDVRGCPTLAAVIPAIVEHMNDADVVAGFNVRRFDLPMLEVELMRHGFTGPMPWDGKTVLDGMEIHRWFMPGTLAGVYRFWCGKDLQGAHGAMADAAAVLEILNAQVNSTPMLAGVSPAALENLVLPEDAATWVEPTGRLKRDEKGRVVLAFGKHDGTPLSDVDAGYLRWILGGAFHPRVHALVREELGRRQSQPGQMVPDDLINA